MARRIPKRGFTNYRFKREIFAVNVGDVSARFAAGTVTIDALKDKGLVPRSAGLVKILGDGDVDKKLTIVAHFFSATAATKLEKHGGVAQKLALPHEKEAAKE